MAVVEGDLANPEEVVRALGLAGADPDRCKVSDFIEGGDDDQLAVFDHGRFVFVLGLATLDFDDVWRRLSRGGRVLRFFLAENIPANVWTIFDGGEVVRWFDEVNEDEGGAVHPLEPALDDDEHPADRIDSIFEAMVGTSVFEWGLDFDLIVPIWALPPDSG